MNSSGNMQSKGICMAKGKVFGRPLGELDLSMGKVPAVVEGLITFIEMYGMYTEGIYRKPGVSFFKLDHQLDKLFINSSKYMNFFFIFFLAYNTC